MSPRVTLGVATYERDTYLAEAVASCLRQTYADLEVLVVLDGGAQPERRARSWPASTTRACASSATRRNRGIAEAYNTIIREAPRRAHRHARRRRRLPSPTASPARSRSSTAIPTPAWPTATRRSSTATGVAARRVAAARTARATSCCAIWCASTTRSSTHRAWSTAASTRPSAATTPASASPRTSTSGCAPCARFRFRDVPGGPLIGLRRHGDNFSDESAQALEVEEVQRALRSLIDAAPLRELVPELDWGVMHPDAAERRALEVLADALERRVLPLPGLAARAARAAPRACPPRRARAPTAARSSSPRSASTTAGGGTTVPRVAAKELARRGWDVTVFHAADAARPVGRALRRARVGRGRRPPRRRPQPPARPVGPRQPAARARRPADHAGLRARCSTACAPTSCTSTTCTTSAPR